MEGMELSEVLGNLCWYDPRHPGHDPESALDRVPHAETCACDNCFYGRDRLAREILRLHCALKVEKGEG